MAPYRLNFKIFESCKQVAENRLKLLFQKYYECITYYYYSS